jgi:hypothetical protein
MAILRATDPLALLVEGELGHSGCKMALGILRYGANPITCAIDAAHGGASLLAAGAVVSRPRRLADPRRLAPPWPACDFAGSRNRSCQRRGGGP